MIYLITGPSAVGKTTIAKRLLEQNPRLERVVTTTTRAMRKGEVDGVDYHFISKEQFQNLINTNALYEWAPVYDEFYGSQKQHVVQILERGHTPLFITDPKGARTLKEKLGKNLTVFFIAPESIEQLETRLRRRGKDTEEQIHTRLALAQAELSDLSYVDMEVVSHENAIDQAVFEIQTAIESAGS